MKTLREQLESFVIEEPVDETTFKRVPLIEYVERYVKELEDLRSKRGDLESAWEAVWKVMPESWSFTTHDNGNPGPYKPPPGEPFSVSRYWAMAKNPFLSSNRGAVQGSSDTSMTEALLNLAEALKEVKP